MAKLSVLAGATSETWNLFIQDSSSTIGAGLKGLAFNSTSLQCGWSFRKGFPASITLASLASATVAYLSGGFVELSQSIMPGWYRFDPPNSILAAGNGRQVDLHFFGATNMAPLPVEVELTAWDNQNSISGGMGALPGSIAGVPGGLPLLDANTLADVNVQRWLGGVIPAVSITGVPITDTRYFGGSISPASAGYVSPDWSKIGSIAAANNFSGTTIALVNTATAVTNNVNANTTSIAGAIVNATLAQVGANIVQWATGAPPTPSITGVPIVDTRYAGGSLSPASAGYLAIDWAKVGSVAATQIFSNTTIAGLTQSVPASVTGNVNANVVSIAGAAVNVSLAQLGTNVVNWGSIAVVAPNIGGVPITDVTYVRGSISPASVGYVAVDWSKTGSIAANVTFSNTTIAGMLQAVSATVSGNVNANVTSIAGVAVNTTLAQIGANVVNWGNSAVPSPSVSGVPIVDTRYVLGSISPASAAYVAIDWSKTGSVAAAQFFSGTTIAQVNTHLNNVNANITSISGVANPASAGYLAMDWSKTGSVAAAQFFSNTTIASVGAVTSAQILGGTTVNAYAPGQSPDSIVLGALIETSITMKQAMQYIGASAAGKLLGASTSAVTISALGNPSVARINAVVDLPGDRLTVNLS